VPLWIARKKGKKGKWRLESSEKWSLSKKWLVLKTKPIAVTIFPFLHKILGGPCYKSQLALSANF
jgi:hypothetical protein